MTALSDGLKMNIQMTKIISLNDKVRKQAITLKGNTIDKVLNFTYLGTNRHNKQNHKNTELKFKTESPLTCYVLLLVKILKVFVKEPTL